MYISSSPMRYRNTKVNQQHHYSAMSNEKRSASIDGDLAAIVPPGPWYTKPHLLKLNFCMFSLVVFCTSTLALSSLLAALRTSTDSYVQRLPMASMAL